MKRLYSPFPTVACSFFLLLLIACLFSKADQPLFLMLNNASQVLSDSFWGFLTTLSDPIVGPLLAFSFFHRNLLFLRALFIAIVLACLSHYALTHSFEFELPVTLLAPETFNMIGSRPTSTSFALGHTLTIFSLMGLISTWYQKRAISVAVLLVATLISFARISVGANWPSDVLFGALTGCIVGWLAVEISANLDKIVSEKLALIGYFVVLFVGIVSLINKTAYTSGQWLSTAAALFAIAYALKSITEFLHRKKG